MTAKIYDHELNLAAREAPLFNFRFDDALLSAYDDETDNSWDFAYRIGEALANDIEGDMSEFNNPNPFDSDLYERSWDNMEIDFEVTCMFQSDYVDDDEIDDDEIDGDADMCMPLYICDRVTEALSNWIDNGGSEAAAN